jgi:CheY-like chemotaxis protein
VDDEVSLEKTNSHVIGYHGERKRILVVDDNVGNTAMLVSLLEPLGFDIDTALNGREALLLAEEQRPNMVMMDLVMPEVNGLEAVTAIRKNRELAEIKIIGASATATDSSYKETFVSLCDDFVTKPIRIDLLLEKIGRLLRIEWETIPAETEGASSIHCEELLVVPDAEDIEVLYELAMLGDMLKIESWATEMENKDHQYGCFADKLRQLARGFKTRAILALAEQYRGVGK